MQLTPATWTTIVSINRRVNTRIKPITDKEHWGLVDRWSFRTTVPETARTFSF